MRTILTLAFLIGPPMPNQAAASVSEAKFCKSVERRHGCHVEWGRIEIVDGLKMEFENNSVSDCGQWPRYYQESGTYRLESDSILFFDESGRSAGALQGSLSQNGEFEGEVFTHKFVGCKF